MRPFTVSSDQPSYVEQHKNLIINKLWAKIKWRVAYARVVGDDRRPRDGELPAEEIYNYD